MNEGLTATMDIVNGAIRGVTRTADTTTAALGAVGGATVNGLIGATQGTVAGVRKGLETGSHSTAAAGLTLAAVGAVGLVEWPLLVTVGGSALAVHLLSQSSNEQGRSSAESASTTSASKKAATKRPAKSARSRRSSTK